MHRTSTIETDMSVLTPPRHAIAKGAGEVKGTKIRTEIDEKGRVAKPKAEPTAPGIPRRSPIQVLTGPDVA